MVVTVTVVARETVSVSVVVLMMQDQTGCLEPDEIAYVGAGVTVTSMKLEQSRRLDVMLGTLPSRVPVTARAQLLALHT